MSLYNNYYFDNCKIPTDTRGFRKSTYIYCSKYIVRAETPNVRGMHSQFVNNSLSPHKFIPFIFQNDTFYFIINNIIPKSTP